ncbi:hypothetical protein RvVAR031_36220 [Agrobacterium vitis]|uniref:hypothetical protein n=1 Tax=Agrobacterium vitis TaxID=373 RepID=UPI0012E9D534|nr:hypothetical protein [Agrobacterium vitis]MUO85594.1 hypothetical protein [Agrobacterium vitis]BCH56012.1 hypothetical protein RvVAR031_36220 [Agrobacterium vitis]
MSLRWVDLWLSSKKPAEFQENSGDRGANRLPDSVAAAYYATLWHEMRRIEAEHCYEPLDSDALALGKASGARALEPEERTRVIVSMGLSKPVDNLWITC